MKALFHKYIIEYVVFLFYPLINDNVINVILQLHLKTMTFVKYSIVFFKCMFIYN